jgi:UDP-GlcNAc:undecaprenyl-phosphate GlcNAc-1-phosphate transferase
MAPYLPAFVLIFGLALAVSLLLSPVARRLGMRFQVEDVPGGRRKHRGRMPRLGGIAMYGGFTVAVIATLVLPGAWFPPRTDPNEIIRLTGLLLGTAFIFYFGLVDDRFELPATVQYVAQFIASLIAIAFLIFIQIVNNPFSGGQIVLPWLLVFVVTVFWFTGMMNTVNWLDGLDGLAAGVSGIVAAVLAIHMIREGQLSVALLPVALLGATLGFLPYNFNPARVFMGSNGSYFLGFAVAALGIISGAKVATVLLTMGLPILDVAWLIVNRWRRGGQPAFNGRDHLHHRLLDIGFSQRQIVLGYYAFCATFGALALFLENRLYKVVALGVLAAAALAVIVWASKQPVARFGNGGSGAKRVAGK